jgi:hypothetical protein
MKFCDPEMIVFYSTLIMRTLKVGDPQATARYFPSRDSSIAIISRGQTFLI